jgi:hypothetical protein
MCCRSLLSCRGSPTITLCERMVSNTPGRKIWDAAYNPAAESRVAAPPTVFNGAILNTPAQTHIKLTVWQRTDLQEVE